MNISPSYSLHKLVFMLDRYADELLKTKFNITYKRFLFLAVLQSKENMTQHDLAIALGYSDPAVSIMLIQLTKDDYVTIKVSPSHARKRIVSLTKKGDTLVTECRVLLDSKFSKLLSWSDVNGKEYNDLTEKLISALEYGGRND
jgi:DNA-binding MarR family transcriptional regulator